MIASTITIPRPTPIAHLAEALGPGRAVLCVAVGTAGHVPNMVSVGMGEHFAGIREVDPIVKLGVEVANVS